MPLVGKNGCEYVDGRFGIFIPIKKATELGGQEIDTIVLNTQERSSKIVSSKNASKLFLNSFSFMINQIAADNIDIANFEGKDQSVKINNYYIPNVLLTQIKCLNDGNMGLNMPK